MLKAFPLVGTLPPSFISATASLGSFIPQHLEVVLQLSFPKASTCTVQRQGATRTIRVLPHVAPTCPTYNKREKSEQQKQWTVLKVFNLSIPFLILPAYFLNMPQSLSHHLVEKFHVLRKYLTRMFSRRLRSSSFLLVLGIGILALFQGYGGFHEQLG